MLRVWAAWMGQEGFSLSCLKEAAESVMEQKSPGHRRGDFASPSGLTSLAHIFTSFILYIF